MDDGDDDEAHVAVEAAAVVPPAVGLRGVDAHGEDGRGAVFPRRGEGLRGEGGALRCGQLEVERCVPGGVVSEEIAVEEHRRVGLGAVELEVHRVRARGD